MTSLPPRHYWVITTTGAFADGEFPAVPEPYLNVQCHRRLRGPYTGGGSLLRSVVPELLECRPELVATRATEVVALAPELDAQVLQPQTLTDLANRVERTRFYPALRTMRIAHGITELLIDWAHNRHPGGVVIAFRGLDDADPTDRELLCVLLRRCDPRLLTMVVETGDIADDDPLGQALARYARRVAARPLTRSQLPPGTDLAQLFIDSDCTSGNPAYQRAYADLLPDERARRHTARAETLVALGEPSLRLGAIPYHLEHGCDPADAGAEALFDAHNGCFDLGYYEAAMELALRGRQLISRTEQPKRWRYLTHKVAACLSYLERGEEAVGYLAELRRESTDPEIHMNGSYQMAMLYTRHLPKEDRDEGKAQEWINNAIVIADCNPDPKRRVFFGAFMRNALALVELHRRNLHGALSLVNEAIRMVDHDLEPGEHLLHRSVLAYNRAQVLAALGDHAAALPDYDEVIRRDPEYGDYYFERASARQALGQHAEALADYATAIRLALPLHEAHFNRAELLRELEDDDGALKDLDYALELEPSHVPSLVNRADLLLSRTETERARADIEHGLALEPRNVNLLSAQGVLLADDGDADGAYKSYTAALAEDPSFTAAWANRAILSYSAGRAAEAVDDLDRAIKLAEDPALRANRAIALQDLGDHRRAVDDLTVAIAALGTDDPDLLYLRGVSRHAMGDAVGAREDWRAHLAAYGARTSPYAEQIRLRDG